MAWDGGVNPKIADNQEAQDCLLPMGALPCWLPTGLLFVLAVPGMSAKLDLPNTKSGQAEPLCIALLVMCILA